MRWNYLSIPNFNGGTIEVWEWISNFVPNLKGMWLLIHAEGRQEIRRQTQHSYFISSNYLICMGFLTLSWWDVLQPWFTANVVLNEWQAIMDTLSTLIIKWNNLYISMAWYKKDVTPMQLSYVFVALTHRYESVTWNLINSFRETNWN